AEQLLAADALGDPGCARPEALVGGHGRLLPGSAMDLEPKAPDADPAQGGGQLGTTLGAHGAKGSGSGDRPVLQRGLNRRASRALATSSCRTFEVPTRPGCCPGM